MTVDILEADAPTTAVENTSPTSMMAPAADAPAEEKPKKAPAKRAAGKKKTVELILTVTGTADGDWRAELKQGTTFLARDIAVAAAAVSPCGQGAARGSLHPDRRDHRRGALPAGRQGRRAGSRTGSRPPGLAELD